MYLVQNKRISTEIVFAQRATRKYLVEKINEDGSTEEVVKACSEK